MPSAARWNVSPPSWNVANPDPPLRIVIITHAYPRWDGDVAGAFIERLCIALSERGHQLHVVAPSDEGSGGRERRHGIPVERVRYALPEHETLAYRGTMTDAARSLGGLRRFMSLVSAMQGAALTEAHAIGADLLHAHWWIPGGLSARRAVRSEALPYVVTVHGTDVALLRRSRLGRWMARRVLTQAARVTAVSRYLAAEVCALCERDVIVQPMPFEVRPVTSASEGGGGIVTVGRLTRQKRLDILLDAMAKLPGETRLTIVGDGPERDALTARATRLGIADRTRFLGLVPPDRVAETIAGADVFAFPAEREGFGLAVAEALALGVPVVSLSDGGGVLDIVSEDAGRVVPPNDPDALAEAIMSLVGRPEARRRAATAGVALAAELAPARVAERFETILRDAVERNA